MKIFNAFYFLYSAALGVFGLLGTIYLLENGNSFTQIGIYAVVLGLSALVFEIPTGIFADRYGPKYALAISSMVRVAVGIIYLEYAHSFEMLVLAFALAGISEAFFSGAIHSEAIALGSGKSMDMQSILGKLSIIRFMGALSGGLVAYLLHVSGFFSPWNISIACFLLSSFYLASNSGVGTIHAEERKKTDVPSIAKKLVTKSVFWAMAVNNIAAIAPIVAWQYILNQTTLGLLSGFLVIQISGLAGSRLALGSPSKYAVFPVFLLNAISMLLLALFAASGPFVILVFTLHVIAHMYQSICISAFCSMTKFCNPSDQRPDQLYLRQTRCFQFQSIWGWVCFSMRDDLAMG